MKNSKVIIETLKLYFELRDKLAAPSDNEKMEAEVQKLRFNLAAVGRLASFLGFSGPIPDLIDIAIDAIGKARILDEELINSQKENARLKKQWENKRR